ncbi:uncharacterized protein BDZ83DRAFT_18594 [Colletotrichum acutatum]|uniref:Uncharacterized protein n=1 Tax=Glomerella acutata TaxID=27357 RepID=A0AAD8XB40_GLOAC|nr:uncharacterized protein BDZ83DRAFT_18594 [Colletotrichum acutatum]KAK1718709.1 hypothetical protein BDZ83DRAFT_18594 [Colletotrichum acutatum]
MIQRRGGGEVNIYHIVDAFTWRMGCSVLYWRGRLILASWCVSCHCPGCNLRRFGDDQVTVDLEMKVESRQALASCTEQRRQKGWRELISGFAVEKEVRVVKTGATLKEESKRARAVGRSRPLCR